MPSKPRFKSFTKYLDQWGARVCIFIGPWQDFKQYITKRWHAQMPEAEEDVNCAGLSSRICDSKGVRKCYCIYMPSMEFTVEDYVTLSHQCIHIASDILTDRGVYLQDQSKEALTYTHDAIYRAFLRKLLQK